MRLDCADAFVMLEDFSRRGAVRLRPVDDGVLGDELTLGTVVPDAPVPFRVAEGRVPGDVMGTTLAVVKIVSPRFTDCLTSHGFTGWSTFPVLISDIGERLDGYRGLAVTGRIGPIDDSLSEKVLLRRVPEGPVVPHRRGLCPDPDSWDGSDLFVPEGTTLSCMRLAVRDALLAEGLVGASFERMSEVTMLMTDL